jgi:hypothetical protein
MCYRPHFHTTVAKSGTPSKPLNSANPAFMIFSYSDFTMDQMSLGVNTEKSFTQHPPKPNGRNKSMCAHDRIPPIQQTPGNRSTVTFAGGAFWTQHSGQIMKGRPPTGLNLRPRETLGPFPLFRSSPHVSDHSRLAMVVAGDTKQIE